MKQITTENLNSLDLLEFKQAVGSASPEVQARAVELSNKMSEVMLKEIRYEEGSDCGRDCHCKCFEQVDAEAVFIAALSIGLAMRSAAFPDSIPTEIRHQIDELEEERKRGA